MADISMCRNIFCPSRHTCYRFTAESDIYQTYGSFTVLEGEDKCDYYWSTKIEDRTWGRNFDENNIRLPKTEYIKLKDLSLDHIKNIKKYFKEKSMRLSSEYLKYFNKRIKQGI